MRKGYQIITPEFVDAMQGDFDGALRCLTYLIRQLPQWLPALVQDRTFELIPICYFGCSPGIGLLMQDGDDPGEESIRSEAISEALDRQIKMIGLTRLQKLSSAEQVPTWKQFLAQRSLTEEP